MIAYFKELWNYLYWVLRQKPYKYLIILFLLWIYRIDFIPDEGVGIGKSIQIVCLLGFFYFTYKYKHNILRIAYKRTSTPVKTLLILYTFAVFSTLWSFIPSLTLYMSIQNLVLIIMMIYFFSLFPDFKRTEKAFIIFSIVTTTFECLCARIHNPTLIIHFLSGASSAALCFSYCFAEWLKNPMDMQRKKFLKRSMIWSLILLITSTSTGANAAVLAGCAIACLLSGKKIWTIIVLLGSMLLYLNMDKIEAIILALNPDKTIEMIKTGNGRESIWNALLVNANQKPILGWGFSCIERTASNVITGQTLSDAHNNFIGMYGSLGIIGLILYIIHLISSLISTFKNQKRPGQSGLFCAICVATINGYSYGFLSGKGCSITVIYFAVITLCYFYSKIKIYDIQRT